MNCPRCDSSNILQRKAKTKRSFNQYQCRHCVKYFNECTRSIYNFTHYPSEIIRLVIFFYYRYKLSLVDVTEIMALRGIIISHETVRQWAQRFGVDIGIKFRARRWENVGKKWHMDSTYLQIKGHWYYLYRAIDRSGDLIDVYLSDTRDKKAAKRFFSQCAKTSGIIPQQITTDKEPGFANAIKGAFAPAVIHRDSKYLNNRMEANHRGLKSWYYPMKGFKDAWCAMISCHVFEEIQQFFRHKLPLSQHRKFIASKFQDMLKIAT